MKNPSIFFVMNIHQQTSKRLLLDVRRNSIMVTPVIMPRQGLSVESCVLTEWKKEVGDKVKKGDLLFSYETDKANFEEEAEVEGILLKRFFEEGDDVPVLTNVCVIGEEGDDVNKYVPDSAEAQDDLAEEDGAKIINEGLEEEGNDSDDLIKISPRARKLAEKNNLDYRHATPTGPEGSIIERDIKKMIDGVEYEDITLTTIRKVIARSMHNSLTSSAQLTIHTSFDASSILNLRRQIKERHKESDLKNIMINDMILFAVSRTVLKYQELNAHFLDDKIRVYKNVHLGVAVDTERGLIVPTIFNANLKTLNSLAGEVKTRIKECREGNIKYDNIHGATFTVTNLGSLGIESFTPVLNPPQTGILGVNTIIQRARERDGEIEYYPAMGLSLTFDHRAIDGAPAARFLKELKIGLEYFPIMLLS
jgi:pyruvate dehydrogenase E2 component (dihydrolipoamide acetyltransferase)